MLLETSRDRSLSKIEKALAIHCTALQSAKTRLKLQSFRFLQNMSQDTRKMSKISAISSTSKDLCDIRAENTDSSSSDDETEGADEVQEDSEPEDSMKTSTPKVKPELKAGGVDQLDHHEDNVEEDNESLDPRIQVRFWPRDLILATF